MLPNFLIIGQMKAGTTSLHAYLRQHPDVFMPSMKELRFFCERIDDPNRRSYTQKGLPVTLEEYARCFEGAENAIAVGEASPQYLQAKHAPLQIRTHLPDVKLIVSLRRPDDRLYSTYLMNCRIGRESRTFEEAFRHGKDERWIAGNVTFPALRRYFDLFGRERILPLRFEDLTYRPHSTVGRVFGFLEVDPERAIDTSEVHNEGGLWKNAWLGRVTTAVRSNRPMMQNLKRRIPKKIWRMAKRVHTGNIVRAPELEPELRKEVAAYFHEDTQRLQELVRLDLSQWFER